jgi:hypothetical protein
VLGSWKLGVGTADLRCWLFGLLGEGGVRVGGRGGARRFSKRMRRKELRGLGVEAASCRFVRNRDEGRREVGGGASASRLLAF